MSASGRMVRLVLLQITHQAGQNGRIMIVLSVQMPGLKAENALAQQLAHLGLGERQMRV